MIESATAADLPAVMDVAMEALTERYTDQFFLAMLEAAPETFLVARAVADPRGPLPAFALAVRSTAVEARLLAIAVRPAWQRHGLGRRLLVETERRLVRAGALGVSLEVREDNLGAIRFYRRAGYEIGASVPRYYADGGRAVVMRKGL